MRSAPLSTRDKVLAFILAYLDRHGQPPMTKVVCVELGLSKAVVCRATARLIVERPLEAEQRNPRALNAKRAVTMQAQRATGTSKTALAHVHGVSLRTVHRIIPLTPAG